MIAGLTTGHTIGLVAVAGIFIAFALVSSFVLPRREPDFPGKRMSAFIGVTVGLFVAMLAAVVIFGAESKKPEARSAEQTTTTATSTGVQTGGSSGDAAKGMALFGTKGCGGCHSITGTFVAGPSLKGVAGSSVTLADGSTVKADHAYLLASIEDPDKQVVKCPNCGPPSPMAAAIPKGSVAPGDAEDLAAYIESLK